MKKIFSLALGLTAVTTMSFAAVQQAQETVNCGATVQLTATPKQGYEFDQWSDGNKENPRTVEVTETKEFTAQFKVSSATGIGETQQSPEVKKVIINDKLYIILDDHMYDTTGKRVR